MQQRNRRFTLIELLVVVGIIVLLAGFLGAAVVGALIRAEYARAEANISALESALRHYMSDWKTLPPIPPFGAVPPTGTDLAAHASYAEARTINADLAFILEGRALIGIAPIRWSVGPYILESTNIDKELLGTAIFYPDGTPKMVYIDPWGHPYFIRNPGIDHTGDTLVGINNSNFVDIWSIGPNFVYDDTVANDDDICNYRRRTK